MFSNIQFIHISTGLHKKSQLKVCSWIESTHFGACPVQLIYFLESFEIRILKMALRGFVVMLYKVHLCLCVLRGSNALYVQLFWFLFIVSAVCDAHDHVDTGFELSENLNNISGSVILHKGLLEELKILSSQLLYSLWIKWTKGFYWICVQYKTKQTRMFCWEEPSSLTSILPFNRKDILRHPVSLNLSWSKIQNNFLN